MRKVLMIHAATLAALSMLSANPVAAEGKGDRAKAAVAEAQGKIDALNAMDARGEVPRMSADAMAALRSAQDQLRAGHKDAAIDAAHQASHLADTAIGVAQRDRRENRAAAQADANMAAQAQVAGARDQAAAAQDQAADAQQRADAANARAATAEQAAASAAADAAAARASAQQPPTTVTTETTRTAAAAPQVVHRTVHRTVHRRTHPAVVTEKTTTTVSH